MHRRSSAVVVDDGARPIAWLIACAVAVLVMPAAAGANPLAGERQFLDCDGGHHGGSQAYNPWPSLWRAEQSGNAKNAQLLRKVARVPVAKWFAGNSVRPLPGVSLERYLDNVDSPPWGGPSCKTPLEGERDEYVGDFPVMVIRLLQHEGCSSGYDGGGPWNRPGAGSAYVKWIEAFVRRVGMRRVVRQEQISPPEGLPEHIRERSAGRTRAVARLEPAERKGVVIVEPDGLPVMVKGRSCLSPKAERQRIALMRWTLKRLAKLRKISTYIDIGSSSWLPRGEALSMLRKVGVRSVRGFALNTTHFNYTRQELRYGNYLAKRLKVKYVVNTAENANGTLPEEDRKHKKDFFCNPGNAGLGVQPTTRTGSKHADAFLWISRPGLSSNGHGGVSQCGRGPTGNVFWLPKALWEARQAQFKQASWPPKPL
jgi:hypothetical protein